MDGTQPTVSLLTPPSADDPGRGASPTSVRGAAAALSLAGVVAGATVTALAAAERPSFLSPPTLHGDEGWLGGPLAGHWPELTTLDRLAALGRHADPAGDDGLLGRGGRDRATGRGGRRAGRGRRGAIVVLTLAPPFSLTDTFNYLHYGRMQPLYGLDPYTALPIQASADPTYRYSTWHHLTSPYGPLFTLGTEALTAFSLPVAYWVLKASVGAAAIAVAVLVAAAGAQAGTRPGARGGVRRAEPAGARLRRRRRPQRRVLHGAPARRRAARGQPPRAAGRERCGRRRSPSS